MLELLWKPDALTTAVSVGIYKLDLPGLLESGYVRLENEVSPNDEIRLRSYRSPEDEILIKGRNGGPALAIGRVNRSAWPG